MKLIFCTRCHDVVLLTDLARTCNCGLSEGRYVDVTNAEYSGACVSLSIDDTSFVRALRLPNSEHAAGVRFDAFVVPPACKTFRRVDGNDRAAKRGLDTSAQSGKVVDLIAYRQKRKS